MTMDTSGRYVDVYVDGSWKRVDTYRPGAEETLARAAQQARTAEQQAAADAEAARNEAAAIAERNRYEAERERQQSEARERAVYAARRPVFALEQQIIDASQDPEDLANVARGNRQRAAYDYRYGLAGLAPPQALAVPADAQTGNLPPGLYYAPMTQAQQIEQFALPQAQLNAQRVAANPNAGRGGSGPSSRPPEGGVFGLRSGAQEQAESFRNRLGQIGQQNNTGITPQRRGLTVLDRFRR